jgi:hypothetical protein
LTPESEEAETYHKNKNGDDSEYESHVDVAVSIASFLFLGSCASTVARHFFVRTEKIKGTVDKCPCVFAETDESEDLYGDSRLDTNAIIWIMVSVLTIIIVFSMLYVVMKSAKTNPYAGQESVQLMQGLGSVLAHTADAVSEAQSN